MSARDLQEHHEEPGNEDPGDQKQMLYTPAREGAQKGWWRSWSLYGIRQEDTSLGQGTFDITGVEKAYGGLQGTD